MFGFGNYVCMTGRKGTLGLGQASTSNAPAGTAPPRRTSGRAPAQDPRNWSGFVRELLTGSASIVHEARGNAPPSDTALPEDPSSYTTTGGGFFTSPTGIVVTIGGLLLLAGGVYVATRKKEKEANRRRRRRNARNRNPPYRVKYEQIVGSKRDAEALYGALPSDGYRSMVDFNQRKGRSGRYSTRKVVSHAGRP